MNKQNPQDPLTIRPMQADEKPAVRAIMCQSFPLIQQWFFSWTPHVLVVEQDGHLLGAILLKTFVLPGDRRGGLVSWVFTAPAARGLGAGQQLVQAGLDFLEAQGCDEIMACVEGYNTSSSKLFATRGFSILSPGEQLRRYRLGLFSLWARIFHFIDIGHFVWARPAAKSPGKPPVQWWGNWLANSLILWLGLWRESAFGGLSPRALWMTPLMVLLFFGVRYLCMRLTAARLGEQVRYRAWESAFPLGLGIALGFGAWFPSPGGLYPTSQQWRYRDLLPKLGRMALAGTIPVLLLTWGAWAFSHLGAVTPALETILDLMLTVGKPLALFDIALPFFPFVSFNGRRIWDWQRGLWGVLAMAAVLIFLI